MTSKPLWTNYTRKTSTEVENKLAFERHLTEAYPLLFPKLSVPQDQLESMEPWDPISGFGIETGPGWFSIIDKACSEIEAINKSLPENQAVTASQIKEKFGGLRFYTNFHNDQIEAIITKAENACNETCETCGATGQLLTNGRWLRTSCNNCKRDGDVPYETYKEETDE